MGYSWTPDQGKKWLIPKGIEMNPEDVDNFSDLKDYSYTVSELSELTQEKDDLKDRIVKVDYQGQIAECRNSEYIGTIGNREEFFVKIIKKFEVASTGGTAFKFRTRTGNLGIFYLNASVETDDEIVGGVGDCIRIKGTPKRQEVSAYQDDTFNNEFLKVTQLNRVEILKVVEVENDQ